MRLDIPNEIKMSMYYMIDDIYGKAENILKHSEAAVGKNGDQYTKIPDGWCSCGQRKFKDVLIPYVEYMKSQRKYVNNLKIVLNQLKPKTK